MKQNADGSIILSRGEFQSLSKVLIACHGAISSLASGGDFVGWDNYRALQMWTGKLKGRQNTLSDYVDGHDGKTVDAWLEEYGGRTS